MAIYIIYAQTELLDLCDFSTPLPEADVVVAADVMYEPVTGRAMAQRTADALQRGSRVLVGDSPGRPGRPYFLEELKRLLPGVDAQFIDTLGTACSGPRNDLICGKGSTSVSDKSKIVPIALLDLKL